MHRERALSLDVARVEDDPANGSITVVAVALFNATATSSVRNGANTIRV